MTTHELNSTPTIRLIVSDVDHTLLNSEHRITERTEKTLRAALDKGVQMMLATGKTFTSASNIVRQLGLSTPTICAQGTVVFNPDGTVRYQQTLDPVITRQIITFAEDRGFSVVAYSGDRLLLRRSHPEFEAMMARYHEPAPEVVGPLQNLMDRLPINKLVVFSFADDAPRAIKALRWQLSMQVNGSVRLMQAGVSRMIEILPPGAGKGALLKQVLKELQVLPEEVLAIGDAENDLEMIQMAGVGVAVGNAAQPVKDAADYVAPSFDDDGVADAVERFILKTQAAETAVPETTAN